ncbi:protein of unknown function [Lactiplantibacillus plantarum]
MVPRNPFSSYKLNWLIGFFCFLTAFTELKHENAILNSQLESRNASFYIQGSKKGALLWHTTIKSLNANGNIIGRKTKPSKH